MMLQKQKLRNDFRCLPQQISPQVKSPSKACCMTSVLSPQDSLLYPEGFSAAFIAS